MSEVEGQHIGDPVGVEHRHQQTFDTQRHSGAGRQPGFHRREQRIVQRRLGNAPLCANRVVPKKTGALFVGIGKFVICVGEFQRTEVQLEPFGDSGFIALPRAYLRQGALRSRIVVHHQNSVAIEARLQPMGHQQVQPIVARQTVRIDRDVSQRGAQFDISRGEWIDAETVAIQIAETRCRHAGAAADQPQRDLHQFDGFVDEALMIPTEPIPLQHRELGVVTAAGFAIAEHATEFVTIADAGGQQSFQRELR